jgi:predicted AlkP superfamily pyrophosphatase or phosphodiesterase
MKTATVFWPGDRAFKHPLHRSILYSKNFTSEMRIDKFLEWIDEDPELSLVTLYFSMIDEVGHQFGPESQNMSVALRNLDNLIQGLFDELKKRGLLHRANIVIMSDHGLLQAEPNGNIEIDRYIPELKDMINWMDYSVVTTIFPKKGETQRVYELLRERAQKHSLPLNVYWTRDLPTEYQFRESSRIGPITIITKPGYCLAKVGGRKSGGFHGYDPTLPKMQSTFIAMGPSIGQMGQIPKTISNLDLYNFVANLLGVRPNANNGTAQIIDLVL